MVLTNVFSIYKMFSFFYISKITDKLFYMSNSLFLLREFGIYFTSQYRILNILPKYGTIIGLYANKI